MTSKLSTFLSELKRRKVYHVGAAYLGIGIAVSLAVAELFSTFTAPDWAAKAAIVVIALGFPIALILAWAYEVRPEEPGKAEPTPAAVIETPEPERQKSIVVLPFDNMSPDPGDAYFSDGLTEEIITNLSYIQALRVISRNSAMVLKGTQKSTGEIAKELQVQYVLEGSVRKAGNDLRVTAQLIDAETDAHLWAEKYDGVLEDVFGVQEDVARSIVGALQLEMSSEERQRLVEQPIKNLQAYECYLRALYEASRFVEEGVDRAIGLLEKALEIEGPNELLFGALGQTHLHYLSLGLRPDPGIMEQAEEWATRAFEVNPDSPDGHTVQGWIFLKRGETEEAVRRFKKALRGDPGNVQALVRLTYLSGISGQMDAARSYFQRASAVDPLTGGMNPGWVEFFSGCYDVAAQMYRTEYEMYPESPYTRWAYGVTLAWGGLIDEACEILDRLKEDTPQTSVARFASFLLPALRGDEDEALRAVGPELIASARSDHVMSAFMASCYAVLGRAEEAVDWVGHSVQLGFINYPFLTESDPFLATLRGDPRYEALVEEARQRWETFEV